MKKVRTRKQRRSRNTKLRKTKSRLRTQKRYGKRSKLVKRTKSKRYNKRQKGGSGFAGAQVKVDVSGSTSLYPTLDRLIPGGTFANLLAYDLTGKNNILAKAGQLETAVFELDEQARILYPLKKQYRNLVEVVDKVKTEIEKLASSTEKDLIRQQLATASGAEGDPLYTMKYIQAYLKITEQGGKEKLGNSIKEMGLLPNYSEILASMGPIEAALFVLKDMNEQVSLLKEDLAMKEQLHKEAVIKVEQRMVEMQKTHDQQLQDEIQKAIEGERGRALIALGGKEQEISHLKKRITELSSSAASGSPVFSEDSPSTSAGAGGGVTQLEDNNVNITSHARGIGSAKKYPNSRIKINATTRSREERTAEKDIIITRVATETQQSGSFLSSGSVEEKTIPFNFSELTEVKIDREKSTLNLALKESVEKHHTFTIQFHDGGGARPDLSEGGERMTLISGVQIEGSPIEKAVKIFQEAQRKQLLTGTSGKLTILH